MQVKTNLENVCIRLVKESYAKVLAIGQILAKLQRDRETLGTAAQQASFQSPF